MSTNRRAVIVSGGTLELEVVLDNIREGDFVIGVDKGINFLDQHAIKIDYIVGDFDSVSPEVIARYKEEKQIPIREFNPVKDASDTEIAVRLAMELGYKELIILGATGSRVDHMWANVQVLAIPYEANVKAVIVDGINRVQILKKETKCEKKEAYGPYFSVFALGGAVDGLTIKGAKYPLWNHQLMPYDSLSVSNKFQDEILHIQYKVGHLILMESKEA